MDGQRDVANFMKEYRILANKEDLKQIEEEEKNSFIKSICDELGLPIEDVWPENNVLDARSKRNLYSVLSKWDLDIVEDGDHGLKIYHIEKEEVKEKNGQVQIRIKSANIIAQWFRPTIVLKVDPLQPNKMKRFYYEMIFKCEGNSILEEGEKSEE